MLKLTSLSRFFFLWINLNPCRSGLLARLGFALLVLHAPSSLAVTETPAISDYDRCLLEQLKGAAGSTLVDDLRRTCDDATQIDESNIVVAAPAPTEIVQEHLAWDRAGFFNPFALTPHKPSFIMLSRTDEANQEPFKALSGGQDVLDDTELIFEVSFKAPVWRGVMSSDADLFFGYTARSWWQLFNKDISSPFRETNYQPELFLQKPLAMKLGGWDIPAYRLGIVHQSNGRNVPLSRSWNRIYAEWSMEKGPWSLSFKPWYRIPEDPKDMPGDPDGDDNPSIWKYMGYGEYTAYYHTPRNHTWSLMTRYNFHSDARGAAQLTWSFPLNDRFRGYAQIFSGYGDSLIDYDESITRFSLGIAITDIIQ